MEQLNRIEEAIEAIQKGEIIIVVDDDNRENEGDFIAAAELITKEKVNFMATHGRGLICTPLIENTCKKLELQKMVSNNTDPLGTAFTVSVDLKGNGVTTGISASDRAKTIKALLDTEAQPHHFSKPGHIFPLIAKEGGVLRRTGHTEAAIDFTRLAGLKPGAVIVEIMNEDGTMARLPQLKEIAKRFDLKLVSIEDLVNYRLQHDSLILKKEDLIINSKYGEFRVRAYEETTNNLIHLAVTKGNWKTGEEILTRIQSSQISNDILSKLFRKESTDFEKIFSLINKEEKGAVLFINKEQQSESLLNRLNVLKKNIEKGIPQSFPPLKMDLKDFGIGAQILHDIHLQKIRVITNSEKVHRVGLVGYGIEIVEYVNY